MLQIELIEPDQVAAAWPELVGYIERAQQRGPTDSTTEQLMERCANDPMWRLVRIDGGAMIVNLNPPDLHVASIGGAPPPGWLDDVVYWLKCAVKATGMDRITLKGRKGWQRRLRPLGFTDIGDGYYGVTP